MYEILLESWRDMIKEVLDIDTSDLSQTIEIIDKALEEYLDYRRQEEN